MRLALGIIWNTLQVNRANTTKEEFLALSTSVVHGQMLEETLFAELEDILPDCCRISQLEWQADPEECAEFDIAIIDERNPRYARISLFDIKYSSKKDTKFTRHLKNPKAIAQVFEAFGYVVSRTVLYTGPTERGEVLWLNVKEFLDAISEDSESVLFPQCSERWAPTCDTEPWMKKWSLCPNVPEEIDDELDPAILFSRAVSSFTLR